MVRRPRKHYPPPHPQYEERLAAIDLEQAVLMDALGRMTIPPVNSVPGTVEINRLQRDLLVAARKAARHAYGDDWLCFMEAEKLLWGPFNTLMKNTPGSTITVVQPILQLAAATTSDPHLQKLLMTMTGASDYARSLEYWINQLQSLTPDITGSLRSKVSGVKPLTAAHLNETRAALAAQLETITDQLSSLARTIIKIYKFH